VNLLDLIHSDGGTLRKVAITNGGEYAGACPFCGGNDRFRLWPEDRGGRYLCRGCGTSGDAIQYLRDYRNLSFAEACAILGHDPGPRSPGALPAPAAAWTPRETTAPPEAWQEKARGFLDDAIDLLWTPAGALMRAWLRNEKGLQDATIRKAVGVQSGGFIRATGILGPSGGTWRGRHGAAAMATGGVSHSSFARRRRSPATSAA